jgi:hypothetical protein
MGVIVGLVTAKPLIRDGADGEPRRLVVTAGRRSRAYFQRTFGIDYASTGRVTDLRDENETELPEGEK